MLRRTAEACFASLLLPLTLVAAAFAADVPAPAKWEIGPFVRPQQGNPIISPLKESTFDDPILHAPAHWEALHTFNPAAVVHAGKIYIFYRAEDDSGEMTLGGHTSRLGMAESADGIHFQRHPAPVFYPAEDSQKAREWSGGVEDPRVVEGEDGTYVLTYTQWNKITYSVGVATSKDLVHWTKHGQAFQSAGNGKYANLKYKSAGIVTTMVNSRLVAAKIKGKYWMYWGEGEFHLATSSDLINWTPLEDEAGQPKVVLGRNAGHFDSGFPEVGPPPILTSKGIVVLYNGRNDPETGDPALGANAYAAGQVLFSRDDPGKLVARAESLTLKPEMPYEKTGQYVAGDTFTEGLVAFHGKLFLYYGCADSMVSVAIASTLTGSK